MAKMENSFAVVMALMLFDIFHGPIHSTANLEHSVVNLSYSAGIDIFAPRSGTIARERFDAHLDAKRAHSDADLAAEREQ
eukprot:gene8167-1420_t